MTQLPLVSVVMPVYNGRQHLRQAIDSVLTQSLRDFELIIVDDGSSDGSPDIVRAYTDARIRLFACPHRGLVETLNQGMQACTGTFIARMDADDISVANRFEQQVAFLQQHPGVALLGSWFTAFGIHGVRLNRACTGDEDLKTTFFQRNCFVHGSVMLRRTILAEAGLYRAPLFLAEDYDLWLRISERARVACLPSSLYWYRNTATQLTRVRHEEMRKRARKAVALAVQRCIYGSDAMGHTLDPLQQPEAAFRTMYYFAHGAARLGHVSLSRRLLRAAEALDPEASSMLRLAWRCYAGRSGLACAGGMLRRAARQGMLHGGRRSGIG